LQSALPSVSPQPSHRVRERLTVFLVQLKKERISASE
jgi:hypothetical protein